MEGRPPSSGLPSPRSVLCAPARTCPNQFSAGTGPLTKTNLRFCDPEAALRAAHSPSINVAARNTHPRAEQFSLSPHFNSRTAWSPASCFSPQPAFCAPRRYPNNLDSSITHQVTTPCLFGAFSPSPQAPLKSRHPSPTNSCFFSSFR